MKKRLFTYALLTCSIFSLSACDNSPFDKLDNDIMLLCTSNSHGDFTYGSSNSNMGYDGVSSYKKFMLNKTSYVTMIDLGDSLVGSTKNIESNGLKTIDVMNKIHYDFAIFGDEDLSAYDEETLLKRMEDSNHIYLSATYKFENDANNLLKKYAVADYGGYKIGFIGINSPTSFATSSLYTSKSSNVDDIVSEYINVIQETISECRRKGVNYIVGLTHLIDSDLLSIDEVVKKTEGFNVVFDGGSKEIYDSYFCNNKYNNKIEICSSGENLNTLSQTIISRGGNSVTRNIESYTFKDSETTEYLKSL